MAADRSNQVLLDAFSRVHESVHGAVEGLDEQQLAYRPSEDANSIAWLVWHLARIQDAQIADIAGQDQVWTADNWFDKFQLPFDKEATGYGQSSEDVAAVKAPADLLLGYFDAVQAQTGQFVGRLTDEDYDKIVDRAWDPPVTMAVRLVSILDDCLQHAGQAAYVHGLAIAQN